MLKAPLEQAAHALLPPSACDRWFHCPGSVVLEDGMPEVTSPYAEEGTRAHAMADAWLEGRYTLVGPTGPKDVVEMEQHVQVYLDHATELRSQHPGNVMLAEHRVRVTEHCWGTVDLSIWAPQARILFIRDYKHGAGVGVDVEDNLQTKAYAVGELLTSGYKAAYVDVGIVQPRYNHPEGAIRSRRFPASELMDFYADLKDAEARVLEASSRFANLNESPVLWEEKYLHPTEKGCRFCKAAPKCPKLLHAAQDQAKRLFLVDEPYDPRELADTLDWLPIFEGWLKNVREFAYAQAEKGYVPPRYKLVDKRASRTWRPDANRFQLAELLQTTVDKVLKPQELLPVGELTKLAPGANQKEREKALEPFTVKESSGHTLVPESDKREAINPLSAQDAFASEVFS